MLRDKTIVLGVAGSIAAYKAVYLLRLCTEAGANVWPVLTPSATRFVGPLSFSVLSGNRAIVDLWSSASDGEVGHVELAHQASVLVIAPATANILERLAGGVANDPLCAIALATSAPWIVAPAMEDGMWHNAKTQEHITLLKARGVQFVMPTSGALGSGRTGMGRMAEPDVIFDAITKALTPADLVGEHIVVTAGPTREALDPARFLSNRSTGRMGIEIAQEAHRRGATVHLICGPVNPMLLRHVPPGVQVTQIETALELLNACEAATNTATALVMAAAPCDYKAQHYTAHKVKKSSPELTLALATNPDILKTLHGSLRTQSNRPVVIGFAAETEQLVKNAQDKLVAKGLDLIVANDIASSDSGFAVETNRATLVEADNQTAALPLMTKDKLAQVILDRLVALLGHRRGKTKQPLSEWRGDGVV